MRAIQYAAPQSLGDAVALLQQAGAKARILAGGTDLIVQVGADAREVDLFVDGKRIPELMELTFDPQRGLTLGAAVPCCRIYEDATVRARYPGLVDTASIIGGTAIQSRASVGGNLCNSGPAADSTPALIAYASVARIAGPRGEREVPVEAFCTAPGRNVLEPDELLVSLHLPVPPPHSGARYLRFIPRNEMDIAEVGVGASLTLQGPNGPITAARIALGAVAPTPLFVREAGDSLVGKLPTAEAFAEAAALAQAAARPITDMRGTAEHRKHLVGVLTRRALRGALERANSVSQ
ncbi:MAG TPA: xanthine dehydrogenase family protein subunit M [Chthonomonadaceae bacterium]|nr:xanthine dehydrogenase family protein subunit M [Chthonomonadaceae bacterium]